MSYKITVEKTASEVRSGDTEYKIISDTGGKDGKSEYGYVTKPDHTVSVELQVYTQFVEELDLIAVINAVNRMPHPQFGADEIRKIMK